MAKLFFLQNCIQLPDNRVRIKRFRQTNRLLGIPLILVCRQYENGRNAAGIRAFTRDSDSANRPLVKYDKVVIRKRLLHAPDDSFQRFRARVCRRIAVFFEQRGKRLNLQCVDFGAVA